jgi:hypothetical protein
MDGLSNNTFILQDWHDGLAKYRIAVDGCMLCILGPESVSGMIQTAAVAVLSIHLDI